MTNISEYVPVSDPHGLEQERFRSTLPALEFLRDSDQMFSFYDSDEAIAVRLASNDLDRILQDKLEVKHTGLWTMEDSTGKVVYIRSAADDARYYPELSVLRFVRKHHGFDRPADAGTAATTLRRLEYAAPCIMQAARERGDRRRFFGLGRFILRAGRQAPSD